MLPARSSWPPCDPASEKKQMVSPSTHPNFKGNGGQQNIFYAIVKVFHLCHKSEMKKLHNTK